MGSGASTSSPRAVGFGVSAAPRRAVSWGCGDGCCVVRAGPGAVANGAGLPACWGGIVGALWPEGGACCCATSPPAPSTSRTSSVSCTLAVSPSLPMTFTTFPRRGLGMVTVALSVITSTSGWSSPTSSPGFTSHLTISPSTTPSPMSGSLNSNWAMSGLVGFQLAQRPEDARRERQIVIFQRVGERRVPAGDARDGRLQRGEATLLHEGADLRGESTGLRRFLHDGAAPGLAHAARQRLDVEGPERPQIDELGIELRILLDRLLRLVKHGAPADHRHAAALADHLRLADRDRVLALRHIPARGAVDPLGLHEDDRVVLAAG